MGWLRVEAVGESAQDFERVTFGRTGSGAGWHIYSHRTEFISRLIIYKDRKHYTKKTWGEYIRGAYPKE